ncbi:MAG TPA: glycosyltransferase family 39 protein, partial [Ignavibacteriaceae bacterium]|nr:glycosyltransferase family 39 protein [Ignavibacteriaceae bacterium]
HNIISNPSELSFQVIKDILNKSDQYPLFRPSGYYPPLVPLLTSLLYFVFGVSAKAAIMFNIFFLFILVFSVYKIGKLIFDKNTGLLASILILLYPIVQQQSVIYYLDLPLAAMTALTIFILLKTNYFKSTKYSIFAGFLFGFGMLTKWTFLFFLVGPLCYLAFKTFYKKEEAKLISYSSKSFKNVILFAIFSIATFGIYYFPILIELISETFKYSHGRLAQGPNSLFSFASICFYPFSLWNEMITPLGFILFIIGVVLLVFSKNQHKILLLIWIIIPYLIFTFVIQTKQPRFMLPWLVPISLIILFCISEFRSIILRKISVTSKVAGISITAFSLIVFLIFFLIENVKLRNSIADASKKNWNISEMVSAIEDDIKSKSSYRLNNSINYLGVIPDHHYINGQTLRYYAAFKLLPLNVIKVIQHDEAYQEFVRKFDRYDYILTKDLFNTEIASFRESIERINKFFFSHLVSFEHLKTFQEPDGSEVSIFKRKNLD